MSGPPFSLIVTDTSPLITLALAEALDALLRPGLPVSIPDAVYIEATRVRGAPGAERIVDWINVHLDQVRLIPTEIGIDQQRRLEEGRSIRAMGELAALEVLDRTLRADATAEALLLFEDSDVAKRRAVPGRAGKPHQHRRLPARAGRGGPHPVLRPHSRCSRRAGAPRRGCLASNHSQPSRFKPGQLNNSNDSHCLRTDTQSRGKPAGSGRSAPSQGLIRSPSGGDAKTRWQANEKSGR